MQHVTIVGSITPCSELARGEEVKVPYTDHVQRLIDRGFVEVVEWHEPSTPESEPGTGIGREFEEQAALVREEIASRQENQHGRGRADRGEHQPVHMAAEGASSDSAVDAAGEGSS